MLDGFLGPPMFPDEAPLNLRERFHPQVLLWIFSRLFFVGDTLRGALWCPMNVRPRCPREQDSFETEATKINFFCSQAIHVGAV